MNVGMGRRRPSSRFGLVAAVLLLPVIVGMLAELSERSARALEVRPNIVLILTDDQRADTLRYMPIVRRTLGDHGVTFTDAYVVDPVCCPSRASILTGLYPHTTGVYSNDPQDYNGGFPAFDDHSTIATWLHDAGYHTGLFGKYLNGYESDYVPPGWDRWFATHETGDYYDYEVTSDGAFVDYGHDEQGPPCSLVRRQRSSAALPPSRRSSPTSAPLRPTSRPSRLRRTGPPSRGSGRGAHPATTSETSRTSPDTCDNTAGSTVSTARRSMLSVSRRSDPSWPSTGSWDT